MFDIKSQRPLFLEEKLGPPVVPFLTFFWFSPVFGLPY